jgi:hypothetical protein
MNNSQSILALLWCTQLCVESVCKTTICNCCTESWLHGRRQFDCVILVGGVTITSTITSHRGFTVHNRRGRSSKYWIVTDESECDDMVLCVIKVKTSHCGLLLRHPIICLHTLCFSTRCFSTPPSCGSEHLPVVHVRWTTKLKVDYCSCTQLTIMSFYFVAKRMWSEGTYEDHIRSFRSRSFCHSMSVNLRWRYPTLRRTRSGCVFALNARVTLLTSSIEFISVFSNPTSSLAFRLVLSI